jgi:peptide/nickel transport system permease protein
MSGDVAATIAGPEASQADIEQVRRVYGLDKPLAAQLGDWAARAVRGDFGESFYFKKDVASLIVERMPTTFKLGVFGMLVGLLLAIPLGVIAALYQGRFIDRLILVLISVNQAVPSFWLALMMIILFGVNLGWLPTTGADSWRHFVMPTLVLGLSVLPALARLARAGMVKALASDYVRTARDKGLSQMSIIVKHALRNAAIPIVAIAAVQFGNALGGSVVIESVFALHGVGYLAWESIIKSDVAVIQAAVLMFSIIYVIITFISDVLNALLDPRIRLS